MKISIILLALFFSQASLSAIWPDTVAPCNTTLDACAEATAEGSFVEVRSNSINETVTVFKSISLVAGNGYHPVFTAGNGIDLTVSSASTHTLEIKGFTLTQGRISVNHLGSGDLDLIISDNEILDNSSALTSIRILQRGSGNLNLDVDYNTINHDFSSSGANDGAIKVINNLNNGVVTGRIYGNTLHVSGNSSVGIGIYDENPGVIDLNVTGNEVYGASYAGIFGRTSAAAGNMDLDITSNAIYANSDSVSMRGIRMTAQAATLKFDAINNSVIGAFDGMNIFESGGSIDAEIFNNLLAYGPAANIPVFTNVAGINNDYNLFFAFDDSDSDFIPGPNHITSKPMIRGLDDAHLLSGSPAIDTADPLVFFFVADAPLIDADGTPRFKKLGSGAGTPDIGAYESGDVFFNHVAQTASHISVLNNPAINGEINLEDLHVTSNWNPAGAPGIYNNSNEGIYYETGNWRVFNEDFVSIPDGATFNIIKNSGKSNTFEHTSTGSTAASRINRSGMDGQSGLIVQASQHWTGIYNDNPLGIFYVSGNWYVNNVNGTAMPVGSNFNIFYQQPSKSAFKHISNAANNFGNSTIINHPMLNGNNCAQIQVTQDASFLSGTSSPLGVWYSNGRWLIFNQDQTTMPDNVIFHINVSPEQAKTCDIIFKTGSDL